MAASHTLRASPALRIATYYCLSSCRRFVTVQVWKRMSVRFRFKSFVRVGAPPNSQLATYQITNPPHAPFFNPIPAPATRIKNCSVFPLNSSTFS